MPTYLKYEKELKQALTKLSEIQESEDKLLNEKEVIRQSVKQWLLMNELTSYFYLLLFLQPNSYSDFSVLMILIEFFTKSKLPIAAANKSITFMRYLVYCLYINDSITTS